jgi:hypothetical protein
MTLFLSAALAVGCAALIWALGAFDRLIDVGSAELGDGRPGDQDLGTRETRAAQESPFRTALARNRLFVKWLFRTPSWANELQSRQRLFRRFRIGSAIALAGFVLFVAGAFLGL